MPILDLATCRETLTEMCNLWVLDSGLVFAERAHAALAAAQLLDYTTPAEQHRAALRVLALGGMYRDFCAKAFDEEQEPEYEAWVGTLLPDLLDALQTELDSADEPDDDAYLPEVLAVRVNAERKAVLDALQVAFGGTVSGVFVELWRSGSGDADEESTAILNADTDEKHAAFEWLNVGAEPYLAQAY